MQQDRRGEELDLILEERQSAQRSAGNRSTGNGGRSGNRNMEYRNMRSGTAARLRSAADVQLWKVDQRGSYAGMQRRSREEELRYRKAMRQKRRKRQMLMARTVAGAAAALLLFLIVFGLWKIGSFLWNREEDKNSMAAIRMQEEQQLISDNKSKRPVIEEKFLTPNEYSRPGEPLPEVTEIFVHYTANAGTSAAQNRSYFENLGITGETSASAHFVIGFNGEIIQCLPLDEIGYAVKEHNYNSVSIECCYLQEDGKFEDATYQSLLELLGWLMNEYDLGPSAVKRHYDSSGKLCPKYYVEHEDAWEQLLEDLKKQIS